MTRKDYELLATSMRSARAKVATESDYDKEIMAGVDCAIYELSVILSDKFSEDNSRFNKARWIMATGALSNTPEL